MMSTKKGFGLIETVICCAIICILMRSISPLLVNDIALRQETVLDSTANELLNDMKLAQRKAVEENRIYHIYFNSIEGSYMIYSYTNRGSSIQKYKKLPDSIHYDSIRSTYTDNKISFNTKGKPLPRPCTISLINDAGQYRRITISVGTDYVSIKD